MTTRLTSKTTMNLSSFALALLLPLLTTTSIRGGTITVGNLPATGTDAATGISTANTYVCCLDFGNNASPPGNINGVLFAHPDFGNQTVNSTNGTDPNYGGSYTITTGGSAACKIARSSSTTPAGQADGNTWKMLNDMIYVGSSAPVNSWLNQTYGGLTPTAQYALRIYYRQWATSPARTINVAFNGEGTLVAYSGNPLNEDAGGAHYIEYDFTASSTSVFVGMTNLVANESAMVYGMTLQQTAGPPPPLVAAVINTQPVGFTNWVGLTNSLSVAATGNPTPTYQWYQNNLPLSGATNATLTFSPLNPTNAGPYYVIVQNTTNSVLNSAQSSNAFVGVLVNPVTNIISSTLSQVALPPTGTDAATGIGTGTGTYLCVLDFGLSAYSGSVNGIQFTPVSINNVTSQSGTDPNYGGSWTASTTDANGFKSINGSGTTPVPGQADGSMASVLNGVTYLGVAPIATTATFDFGGLAVGGKYELRYYYPQWTADSPLRTVQFTFNGDGTNATVTTDQDIGGAHYIEYDFTAARSDVSLLLTDASSQANYGPMIYAITLQQTAAAPAAVAPTINAQPVGFTNWAGLNESLSVNASGSPLPAYQWYQNNLPLSGATSATLSFSPLDPTNAGSYYVAITNVAGSTNSSVVLVGVLSGTNVISPKLSQVQLPTTGTDAATGIGAGTNYLCVLDFGSAAFAASINGVNFTPVNLGGGTNASGQDPNYGGTWAAATTDTNGFRNIAGGGANVNAQADGQMAIVLAGVSYLGVAPVATAATFNFGGLTPGAHYDLRYYYRQWDAGDAPPRPVQFVFNGDGADTTFQADEDLGGAYYLDYSFTAAGTNVSLVLNDVSGVANQGPMIYAITLQGPVVLNYSLSGSTLTLSWDPSVTGYVLERAGQLPAGSWTPVSGVVNNTVPVDTSSGTGYFRLHKQ